MKSMPYLEEQRDSLRARSKLPAILRADNISRSSLASAIYLGEEDQWQ